MQNYLPQLIQDIKNATLNEWLVRPPHFHKLGIPEGWLELPVGYSGPPFGFGRDEAPKIAKE